MNLYEFDPNSREHLKERFDALEAEAATATVEFLNSISGRWEPTNGTPSWHARTRYRRAPVPAVKWWSEPSHVPCPCWIKGTNKDSALLVDGVKPDRIFARHCIIEFKAISSCEWAPTHLGPFKPCTVPQ